MFKAASNYLADVTLFVGNGWNRFWFTETEGWNLALLRQLVGAIAFLWLLSFSWELTDMFGPSGWVSMPVVQQVMTGGDPSEPVPGISHLFWMQSPTLLWASHLCCLLCLFSVAIGRWPRVTTALALLVVLSYVHRAPMLTTPFETLLCMLLLYLVFAPSYSMLQWKSQDKPLLNWTSNLGSRLIQVHLCGIYWMIATSKLATPAWTSGDGLWYLITDSQHRLVDLTPLLTNMLVLNALTHAWVLFELAFPILIWIHQLRPLLIALSTMLWIVTALLSGQVGYCVLMLIANLAFVPAGLMQRR